MLLNGNNPLLISPIEHSSVMKGKERVPGCLSLRETQDMDCFRRCESISGRLFLCFTVVIDKFTESYTCGSGLVSCFYSSGAESLHKNANRIT